MSGVPVATNGAVRCFYARELPVDHGVRAVTAARSDPQRDGELVAATRALLTRPWRTAEADPEIVALVRRHADALDAWFTQELNYRLVVTADTARLVKVGHVPADRPLRTISTTPRAFTPSEYTALVLVLAATTSGPDRTSLRDLVNGVHSAAAEAGIVMDTDTASRRALVTALRWLIAHGMVRELDRGVGLYEHDADADALLEVRQDRMALLPVGAVAGAETPADLLARARARGSASTAARRRLVEDPVVHADDLDPARFAELRRHAGDEARRIEARTGLVVEARAEGFAALDVDGGCSDVAFPGSGTVAARGVVAGQRADLPVPAGRGPRADPVAVGARGAHGAGRRVRAVLVEGGDRGRRPLRRRRRRAARGDAPGLPRARGLPARPARRGPLRPRGHRRRR